MKFIIIFIVFFLVLTLLAIYAFLVEKWQNFLERKFENKYILFILGIALPISLFFSLIISVVK